MADCRSQAAILLREASCDGLYALRALQGPPHITSVPCKWAGMGWPVVPGATSSSLARLAARGAKPSFRWSQSKAA